MSNLQNNTGIPERLITKADLVVGDVLIFRPVNDLIALDKSSLLVYGWHSSMSFLLDKEYTVTQEMLDLHGELIAKEVNNNWTYHIGVSMLRKKPTAGEEGPAEEKETVAAFNPNIRNSEQKEEVLEQMKALVDKKRLKTLLSISASSSSNVHIVSDAMVEEYLDIWAKAKYDFFLLFDKKLRVSTDVEVEMDDDAIKTQLQDVYDTYPVYAPILSQFGCNEYRDNAIKYTHDIKIYAKDAYKVGMKLSKFLSNFIHNDGLDIEVSKIMQNKTATHTVYASIDPYDYLTMSLNQHNWDSCHRITDGCYGTGPLSYLLDDATMIAYRDNGKEYDYNFYNLKFKGNSKSWRQCIYFDKSTCSMIFGRQYPNNIQNITKAIRVHLEDLVVNYIKAPRNLWTVLSKNILGDYEDVNELHYSDVENDYDYKFVKLKDIVEPAFFSVGYEAPCLMCGEVGEMSNGGTGVCCECRDDHGYSDN